DNYYKYLQDSLLLSKANLYSIDRPGYGFPNFGNSETSIKKQTEVVVEIIDQLPEQKVIVLGHSYGGPIAAYSSLFTSKVKSVLMLAPAIDPENEKVFWFAYISKWKLTKWMIPGAMGVAGDEKFTHVKELEKLKDVWKRVHVPIIHIHGTDDIVVPFENLKFSTGRFNKQYLDTIVLQKENHFLPWKRYSLVKKELLELIDKLE
ncbi:MAG: alpha/beta hydrolase, partial [Flavobacteriaceae bacterium]|nr:alpha/beta hydrolase [Flavobacteriaceae bacterium]